ncbi:MAG: L,D-transpeptidase family protein [Gammaproteobacteria bacterium]|uniref:L,D-transpeptidase family protein n=1 Tax=Pseudomaricurvus alcaniphilus TaxID=1166482 RepID=UPI00140D54B7|nr:L,D-transpeptidase family protein [Pseudomaricurvus alcaniphilus]MBR9912518.1 L,D-transpeptidase family protein [Gammaproteobacteria bacterium]NHN36299.1 L,D-transpeptidase family protein [Pseudomaricurvus alcaniphilus]
MKAFLSLLILILLLPAASLADASIRADRVLVKKSERALYLIKDGIPYQKFNIALGPRPRGHKQASGDERTPEGSYVLDFKNADSKFYKSIRISYPNAEDSMRAALNDVDPGGFIMIHGLPNDSTLPASIVQQFNWTDGCIAVTNQEMDKIWLAVELGTPIDILP